MIVSGNQLETGICVQTGLSLYKGLGCPHKRMNSIRELQPRRDHEIIKKHLA